MAQDKFYYPYDSIALKYIDQSIVKQLIKAYKQGDPIAKIKQDFPNAPVTNSLYANLPYEITDEKCICGGFIYLKIPCRSSNPRNLTVCPNCGHEEGTKNCVCSKCTQRRTIAEQKENDGFLSKWSEYQDTLTKFSKDFQQLDLMDILDLSVILSYESLVSYTDSKISFNILYTPDNENNNLYHFNNMDREIIQSFRSLVDKHILIPVVDLNDSQIQSFKRFPDLSRFPYYLVKWKINLSKSTNQTNSDIKSMLLERNYTKEELSVLWDELYHSEFNLYLQDQVEQNLGFQLSDIEVMSISTVLGDIFPLSKAYYLVYFSVSSALRFQVQKKAKEKVLRTYLINKIMDMAVEKQNTQHIIKDFNRPMNLYFSVRSRLIAKEIFNLNNDYLRFTKRSAIENSTVELYKNNE